MVDEDSRELGIDVVLGGLRERAETTLAEFMAMDPKLIDISERWRFLPGMVLDALAAMKTQLNAKSQAALDEREREERARRQRMREAYRLAGIRFRKSLPPNWKSPDIEFPSIEELEELQLREGLPLAWLPPNRVLGEMLRVRSSSERIALIELHAGSILDACTDELARLTAPDIAEWAEAAGESVRAMRNGTWRAGQALATVGLDSAVREFVTKSYPAAVQQRDRSGNPTPPGASERSVPTWNDVDYPRALLVFYGIWGAHQQFFAERADDIPAQFSRHATVHAMSARQYTIANALIALMHLVSLLCLLDEMMNE